jgi:DNA-binding GntR family transcriptional regulator
MMKEDQLRTLVLATEIVCAGISSQQLAALQESLDQACDVPARWEWGRKVAAHADFFGVLADAADAPRVAEVLNNSAKLAHDLMAAVGRGGDFVVINSRKRMLIHIRAGNASDAAAEMEEHIRILQFLRRLAVGSAREPRVAANSG